MMPRLWARGQYRLQQGDREFKVGKLGSSIDRAASIHVMFGKASLKICCKLEGVKETIEATGLLGSQGSAILGDLCMWLTMNY